MKIPTFDEGGEAGQNDLQIAQTDQQIATIQGETFCLKSHCVLNKALSLVFCTSDIRIVADVRKRHF